MRLPTRIHGMLDYLLGALLIASPWLFGFADGGAEQWAPVVLGVFVLLYSLFTDYECGVIKRLPMRVHLLLDAASGLLLAASPWLLGFADEVRIPHVALGTLEIVLAALTRRAPGYRAAQRGAA